jgi:hypothetical protein
MYQFLLWPHNIQLFKPDTNPELSGYENSNPLTEIFIDIIKTDTGMCFS